VKFRRRRTPRTLRAVAVGGACFALATLARADAPSDQYGYFDTANQTIFDNYTRLEWERYPPTAPMAFSDALTHCATLTLGSAAGSWRLPSYKELLTIVDEAPHTEYENGALVQKAIDPNAFPQAPVLDNEYWTSSPNLVSGGFYGIDFTTGAAFPVKANSSGYVRCVQWTGP
jgi:Protein of unknown function (DUF1566)